MTDAGMKYFETGTIFKLRVNCSDYVLHIMC